jgi:hypothetical protein
MIDFQGFSKISRLSRNCIVTEKIDGTNCQIYIDKNLNIYTGSKNRWITPADDHYGFARWVVSNKEELLKLGPGRHFGEWWGKGIQRSYGLNEKRFSLFNTERWSDDLVRPSCCHVVPVIKEGLFDTNMIFEALSLLEKNGSYASPGFMNPEGIVVFHTAANMMFKKTIKNDDIPKSKLK